MLASANRPHPEQAEHAFDIAQPPEPYPLRLELVMQGQSDRLRCLLARWLWLLTTQC
jgi:hypothetical protein